MPNESKKAPRTAAKSLYTHKEQIDYCILELFFAFDGLTPKYDL